MKRFSRMLAIMLVAGSLIGVGVFWILYNTAFEQISRQLITTVQSRKAIMTAVAEFDERERADFQGSPRLATLSQFEIAHDRFEIFGNTGEFTVAERDGPVISFIFRQRHSSTEKPSPISFDSELAEPMRRALSGQSGIIIALDYRGQEVLAAYEPVNALQIGIVAKVDMSEIRDPFIRAAFLAILAALLLFAAASALFVREALPITQKLKDSEKLYRNLVEGQSELVCRSNRDGIISFANQAYLTYFGKTLNQMIGVRFTEFIPQEYRKGVLAKLSQLSKTRRSMTHEHQVIKSSGDSRWLQWTNTLLESEEGGSDEIINVGIDITERRLTEEKLRAAEIHMANLGRIVESSINEIYVFDCHTLKFEMVNKGALANLGFSKEELQDLTPLDIKPEISEHEFRALLQPLLDGKASRVQFETIHERKDKTTYNVEVIVSYSEEADHSVFFAIINDLTQSKSLSEELSNAFEGTIEAISLAVEIRDSYTAGHQQRVSDIAVSIAREMGIEKDRIIGIQWGAKLHDIGKIGTPAEILAKPTRLSDDEFNLIKQHARAGYDILKGIKFPWPIAEIAYQHHERLNGTGYPQGLKGDEICLEARIVGVADVMEAITAHRPYRPALGIDVALKEIKDKRGEFYDANVVDACLKLAEEKRLPL
jgi:PAS domain S-box-containing protein/putative nucleotidyltransferase with HDIG domain